MSPKNVMVIYGGDVNYQIFKDFSVEYSARNVRNVVQDVITSHLCGKVLTIREDRI